MCESKIWTGHSWGQFVSDSWCLGIQLGRLKGDSAAGHGLSGASSHTSLASGLRWQAGTMDCSAYTWFSCGLGFLTAWLPQHSCISYMMPQQLLELVIPMGKKEAALPFITQPWKSYGIHSTIIYWLMLSQSCPDSKGRGHRLHLFMRGVSKNL